MPKKWSTHEQRIQANTTLSSCSPSNAKVTASANKQASTLHIQKHEHTQSIETQTYLTWPIKLRLAVP